MNGASNSQCLSTSIMFLEWLAKFHGLSYIAMQRHLTDEEKADKNSCLSWLEKHPWIRHSRIGGNGSSQHSSLNEEILESRGN